MKDWKQAYQTCKLCPRECGVDRLAGERGYCHQTSVLKVARAALHYWEEPCISGEEGSGTVFFSGCAMGCVYCQNHNIALGTAGVEISVERLVEIFMELQRKHANNINLVTPGHYIPSIIEAVTFAKNQGLHIPIVYNTSAYEKCENIELLRETVDIWLPDLKYMHSETALKYSNCPDYFSNASEAISKMVELAGTPEFDERGIMKRGVIVRHLTLPGYLEESKGIIQYLYETFENEIYLSIMNQFTPVSLPEKYHELNRTISEEEYDELIDYAIEIGVEQGFIQEGGTASESFIPEFDGEGVANPSK